MRDLLREICNKMTIDESLDFKFIDCLWVLFQIQVKESDNFDCVLDQASDLLSERESVEETYYPYDNLISMEILKWVECELDRREKDGVIMEVKFGLILK
jgi:hypothetical protein